jgi:hypothetical protein
MGDFAAGAENDNSAIAIYYELTTLMKLISFPWQNELAILSS